MADVRPAIDEEGHLDWGAFGTHDFERLRGPFDKARYKADKLEEDVRNSATMLSMFVERLPEDRVCSLHASLRDESVDIDELDDLDEYGFARCYLRIKRLRSEIRDLRRWGWEHRSPE